MNSEHSPLISQWIIPILTNIIAAIILYFAKPVGLLGKRWFVKGTTRLKARKKLNAEQRRRLVIYITYMCIGFLPLGLNIWFLYRLIRVANPPARSDVLAIFVFASTIVYWAWTTLSKFRNTRLSDYTNGDA